MSPHPAIMDITVGLWGAPMCHFPRLATLSLFPSLDSFLLTALCECMCPLGASVNGSPPPWESWGFTVALMIQLLTVGPVFSKRVELVAKLGQLPITRLLPPRENGDSQAL
jgi:hypothetical protein